MCGIAGQLGRWGGDPERWLDSALEAIRHRGPDDAGTWSHAEREVYLGHRRLAIVDLSPGGHQPFMSDDGRYVVVFNGEVYNHDELRNELDRSGPFRTTSDTEVLVRGIMTWGVVDTLRRVNGMFAIAVWDRELSRLCLTRDRVGEKPLFVQRRGNSIRFGSELKVLLADGAPRPTIDRSSLASFMRFGYVPAPDSIFEGVHKVRPGTVEWYEVGAEASVETCWRPTDEGSGPIPEGAGDELHELLRDSVRLRMQADVPVGAFLSGGIDSSLVAALMTDLGASVRTFTIGFDEPEFDESTHAGAVARHLGTDHTELRVSDSDALAIVSRLPILFDEPFADQSAIPTTLVAQLARSEVTVALSGDGGDELFGGYTRYSRLERAAPLSRVPRGLAQGAASGSRLAARAVPRLAAATRTAERVAIGISAGGTRGLYRSIVSLWEAPGSIVVGDPPEHPNVMTEGRRWTRQDDLTRRAMRADFVTYLPDDILVKVDRTSMSVALEARVPLLDHRVVEWAFEFARPRQYHVAKQPLREVLDRYVPATLIDRPKMGFGAPVGSWLRGPLRSWAEELLSPELLASGDLLDPEPIRARWAAHLSGNVDQSFPLWAVLCFQAWRQEWGA